MALVSDNFQAMAISDKMNITMDQASTFNIRFNIEVLKGCEFHCPGCYVNRDNAFDENDLEILLQASEQFSTNGFHFEEIIIGPTDFFAAYNTIDLITNPKFAQLIQPKRVMTILSTLLSHKNEILKRIGLVNQYLGKDFEVEVLIPFDVMKILSKDPQYIHQLKEKIELLQFFDADVEYALQMNIQDTSQLEHFDLFEVAQYIKNEFSSITEFNPSFLRTGNDQLIIKTMSAWNQMLNKNFCHKMSKTMDNILFTMGDPIHAGLNEVTYNFKKGIFYECPFIYENVFDKGSRFKITPNGENGRYLLDDFINHRHQVDRQQLQYLEQTDECSTCPHVISCVGKQVIHYMMDKKITHCLLAKDVMDLYA